MTRLLRSLGRGCAEQPVVVIVCWLVVAAVTTLLSLTVGAPYSNQSVLPGTEVQAANEQLAQHFPAAGDESADVVVTSRTPASTSAAMPVLARRLAALPHVAAVSPRLSADHSIGWLSVRYGAERYSLGHSALAAAQRVARSVPGVTGYVAGSLSRDASMPSAGLGEKVGIAVAVLVLLFAFGSVIAALMPIACAAVAIVTGLAVVHLLCAVYPFNDTAPELATMMGLGVGIDYALFIVTRHRDLLRTGVPPQVAAASATATSGTSVLWAGITVVAAICGLAFAGIPIVSSLGFASAIVVALSVTASLTLLPALLSLTDDHIDRLHISLPHHRAHHAPGWTRWARAIERRPWRYLIAPALALAVLALPVGSMRLGEPDASSAAHDSAEYRGFTLLGKGFGVGANAPLLLVAKLSGSDHGLSGRLHDTVVKDRDVVAATPLILSPDRRIGVMTVQPGSGPQDAATSSLVVRLRTKLLPPLEHLQGSRVLVTGFAAGRYDVAHRVLARLPWFIGAVLGVSFLLLLLVFRSLLVPLKAVVLNILSIAAALGVTVAVFTWGWLRAVVGVTEPVPLEDVVPMLMFAIVFGLSMDYEVFLLSRVREEWRESPELPGSVVPGLASTARVISAAAAIMVSVFLSFTLANDVVVKMIGFGLAVAVFLDATVIRLVLVPATMSLLGERNWWLPGWLDRALPHVDLEGAVPVTPYRQEDEVALPRSTA
jgi:RND superfamily putative drug exporter